MRRPDSALESLRRWDVRACASLNRAIRYRVPLAAFRAVSWLGNGVFWYALMLGLLLAHGEEAFVPVLHMVGVGLACTFAYRLLKAGTLRPRPYQVHAHIAAGATPLDRFSFPSGHTLHAVAFSILACTYYPDLVPMLATATVLTAVSRVVLGLHYPSDVLAGAGLGALIACASLNLG